MFLRLLPPRQLLTLLTLPRYRIISQLFRKKNQADAQQKQQAQAEAEPKNKEEGEVLKEDEEYNFFERRREIDTGVDFSKLRETSTWQAPEKLGEGGIEELLYWAQSAVTPEQIKELVLAFNRLPRSPHTANAALEKFKSSVVGSVYHVDSLQTLRDYAVFALRFDVREQEFWEKVEFRCPRFAVASVEEVGWLVDIVFAAGQYDAAEDVFNYAQKVLDTHTLTAEQYIKLFLVFSALKRGEKQWIEKLLKGISETIELTDAEQLTGVLPSLKQAKKLPVDMNPRLQVQVDRLLPTLSLRQLLTVTEYFGFELEDDGFWGRLERRLQELLGGKEVEAQLLEELVLKAVLSYRLTTDFVRRHIVPHLSKPHLDQFPPRSLAALSKGLYIYELEGETKNIEEQISQLLIGKISQGINQISDDELVAVIRDYNLTRHGNREVYIFFEEVIKLKFLRHYDPEVDRNTIELLATIYEKSGMCSRQMLDALNNLILQ